MSIPRRGFRAQVCFWTGPARLLRNFKIQNPKSKKPTLQLQTRTIAAGARRRPPGTNGLRKGPEYFPEYGLEKSWVRKGFAPFHTTTHAFSLTTCFGGEFECALLSKTVLIDTVSQPVEKPGCEPYCQDSGIDDTSSRFFGSPAALLARAETVNRYLSSLAPCRRTKLLVTKCRLSRCLGSKTAVERSKWLANA
jgi:hypothetical protein